jgi:hypothetical protein
LGVAHFRQRTSPVTEVPGRRVLREVLAILERSLVLYRRTTRSFGLCSDDPGEGSQLTNWRSQLMPEDREWLETVNPNGGEARRRSEQPLGDHLGVRFRTEKMLCHIFFCDSFAPSRERRRKNAERDRGSKCIGGSAAVWSLKRRAAPTRSPKAVNNCAASCCKSFSIASQ